MEVSSSNDQATARTQKRLLLRDPLLGQKSNKLLQISAATQRFTLTAVLHVP
uniref:Uncharacterized protein n=1 Tax=Arundo donax TaxID=35708 RepID=A0A0A8Y225_ARUDO